LFEETAELNSQVLEPFRRPAEDYFGPVILNDRRK
jgi:hypothetical protein